MQYTTDNFKKTFELTPFVGQRIKFDERIIEVDSIDKKNVTVKEYPLAVFEQKLQDEKSESCYVILVSEFSQDEFDCNNDTTIHLFSDSHVCLNDKSLEKKLTELFSYNFPDNDMIRHYVSESPLIVEHLNAFYDPDNFESDASSDEEHELFAHRAKVKAFDEIIDNNSQKPLLQYLLDTFNIDELVDDDFFKDVLHSGLKKIDYEKKELFQ